MGALTTSSTAQALATVAAALDGSDNVLAIVIGDALVVAWANGAFGRLTGWTRSAAAGRALLDVLGVTADQDVVPRLRDSARARQSVQSEVHCTRPDGTRYWFGFHLMPAPDGTCVLLGRDISERRQARSEAAFVEAVLATCYREIDAPAAIMDADGRILMANPAFDRLRGHPVGASVGRTLLEAFTPDGHALIAETLAQRPVASGTATVAATLLRADRSRVDVRLGVVCVERTDMRRFHVVTVTPVADPHRADLACFTIAGKIRLVGLDEVKAVLGGRWEAMAERALQSAEHIVKKRIGPKDRFTRTADHGLLICFAELSEAEATRQAGSISAEIRQRLIGLGSAAGAAQVSAHVARIDHPDAGDDLDLPLPQLLETRLNARRASIEAAARRILAAAITDARPVLHPVLQRDGALVAQYARIPSAIEERIAAAAAALPPDEAAAFDLEIYRLRLTAEAAREALAHGARAPVLVDLDFAVLETRLRTEHVVEAFMKLEARVREQLVLMLTNQPSEMTAARLRDCLQRLKPYCREVGLAPQHLYLPPDGVTPGGSLTVAVACDAVVVDGVIAEDRLFAFIPSLHARRGRLLVHEVPDADVARDLREMGVDWISLSAGASN